MKKKIVEYKLICGLFDKDTKKQEISTQEAISTINNILLQYVEGATVYMGDGLYKHIDNTIIQEPSVVILLYYVNNDIINKIIKELCQQLNQECITRTEATTKVSFDNGKDKLNMIKRIVNKLKGRN